MARTLRLVQSKFGFWSRISKQKPKTRSMLQQGFKFLFFRHSNNSFSSYNNCWCCPYFSQHRLQFAPETRHINNSNFESFFCGKCSDKLQSLLIFLRKYFSRFCLCKFLDSAVMNGAACCERSSFQRRSSDNFSIHNKNFDSFFHNFPMISLLCRGLKALLNAIMRNGYLYKLH